MPWARVGGRGVVEVKSVCGFGWWPGAGGDSGTAWRVGLVSMASEALEEEPRLWWAELRRGGIEVGAWEVGSVGAIFGGNEGGLERI